MRYLADTNVISQRTKVTPVPAVASWLQQTGYPDISLSVVTILEVRAGAESMPKGAKRNAVESWLENDLLESFRDRILPVDVRIADLCGRMAVQAKANGQDT